MALEGLTIGLLYLSRRQLSRVQQRVDQPLGTHAPRQVRRLEALRYSLPVGVASAVVLYHGQVTSCNEDTLQVCLVILNKSLILETWFRNIVLAFSYPVSLPR